MDTSSPDPPALQRRSSLTSALSGTSTPPKIFLVDGNKNLIVMLPEKQRSRVVSVCDAPVHEDRVRKMDNLNAQGHRALSRPGCIFMNSRPIDFDPSTGSQTRPNGSGERSTPSPTCVLSYEKTYVHLTEDTTRSIRQILEQTEPPPQRVFISVANKEGTCSVLCDATHGSIRGTVVVSAEDFWLFDRDNYNGDDGSDGSDGSVFAD